MIGNDVVDLLDAESRPESFRPRFDARVFDESERAGIEADERPLARRWAHWGAKEAAFKLGKRFAPDLVFTPGRWVARFEAPRRVEPGRFERSGRIELPGRALRPERDAAGASGSTHVALRSIETEDWVHVLAIPASASRPQPADWRALRWEVARLDGPVGIGGVTGAGEGLDASRAVRRRASAGLAAFLDVDPGRITIGGSAGQGPRGERGGRSRIPIVRVDDREIDLALSLSHHGRWVAWAMSPRVDWAINDGWAGCHGLGATA